MLELHLFIKPLTGAVFRLVLQRVGNHFILASSSMWGRCLCPAGPRPFVQCGCAVSHLIRSQAVQGRTGKEDTLGFILTLVCCQLGSGFTLWKENHHLL